MDTRRPRPRIVKLPGLPEIPRRANGTAKIIDATVKPAVQRSNLIPFPKPTLAPKHDVPERLITPQPQIPSRTTPTSPCTDQCLIEGVKRLDEQLHVISEQLESFLKIFIEQQQADRFSNTSGSRGVTSSRYSNEPPNEEPLADISMDSREYLSRNNILDSL